jgi:hypothetical protein
MLMVSDVFLVKSVVVAAGKLGTVGLKGVAKWTGSHTWSATSKWLAKVGLRDAPGQVFHHWLIPRNQWGKKVPEFIKNQPWNLLKYTDDTYSGATARMLHNAVEAKGTFRLTSSQRFVYGTPNWAKHLPSSAVGHGVLAGSNRN